MKSRIFSRLFLGFCLVVSGEIMGRAEESLSAPIVDTIIASVDGQPITLRDLGRRIGRPLRTVDAASETSVQAALDAMIEEQIVRIEAEAKQLSVSQQEVEIYVAEVAERNGISAAQLKATVEKGGKRYADYLKEVEFDILRSKLAGSILRGSVSITEKEIDDYLRQEAGHSFTIKSSSGVDLSQVTIARSGRADRERRIIDEVREFLEDGGDVGEIADEIAEPDGVSGSELGVVSEKDLSPEIIEAIRGLDEDEVSKPVMSGGTIRIFRVNDRQDSSDEEESEDNDEVSASQERRREIRAILEQKRMQDRIASFSAELLKRHSVEKLIQQKNQKRTTMEGGSRDR
jgi:peptidyl-prolyl cis-trans isomerase SurA